MAVSEYITIFQNAINAVFQINSDKIVYLIIFIILAAWLSLFAYMLIRKTELAEQWIYPDFAKIGSILILGFVSFALVTFFFYDVLAVNLMQGLTATSVSDNAVITFMIFYMVFGLWCTKKQVQKELKFIPAELPIFIKNTAIIAFGLFIIGLGLQGLNTFININQKDYLSLVLGIVLILAGIATFFKAKASKKQQKRRRNE